MSKVWWLAVLAACVPPRELVEVVEETAEYELVDLYVYDTPDLDDDGVVDNHLSEVLASLDAVFPEEPFGADEFDAVLLDNIRNWSAVQVGTHIGEDFHLHVATGTRDEDGDVGSLVDAAEFEGQLIGDTFEAGPGDLALELVVVEGVAPQPLDLLETRVEGVLAPDHSGLRGTFVTQLPVNRIIDSFVAPALPESGYDLDGDGQNESREQLLDQLRTLAPSLADGTVDGEPVISAAIVFDAVRTE